MQPEKWTRATYLPAGRYRIFTQRRLPACSSCNKGVLNNARAYRLMNAPFMACDLYRELRIYDEGLTGRDKWHVLFIRKPDIWKSEKKQKTQVIRVDKSDLNEVYLRKLPAHAKLELDE